MSIAIYLLLITWIVLLALLIGIYALRLQGYDNYMEWKNRDQEVFQPEVVTPEPTATPVVLPTKQPTEIPTPTMVPTMLPTISPEPTELPTV